MTAETIVARRANISEDEAIYYVQLAGMRVRERLGLEANDPLSRYTFQLADIAVLYWQKDQATRQSAGSVGFESVSVSEGGVKKTVSSLNGSYVVKTYDGAIDDILDSISGNDKVVFL